jgi:hypothetical protein
VETGIINDSTMLFRQVPCPAAMEVADVRGSRLPNTPGVRCRITHDTLSADTDPRALVRWCCNELGGDGGYNLCPVWQFDKERIERGQHSLGDEREAEAQNERTVRDDLTGSEYGDTSFMDAADAAAADALDWMHEKHGAGLTGSATNDIPEP